VIVGVSISASPDLPALGFGPEHLRAVNVEVAQHLLVAGHDLAYGGDLRPGGFTLDLMQLVSAYVPHDGQVAALPRVRSHLAWPIHLHASEDELAEVATVATLECLVAPDGATVETPFTRARGLNDMRRRMTEDVGARISLGGKTSGFSGLLPGIAEEVLLMLEAGKPVYLLGAFGGCTRLIVEAIRGGALPGALTAEGGEAVSPEEASRRRQLALDYDGQALAQPGYDRLKSALCTDGMAKICASNGLSPQENQLLFSSPDHQLLVALVLKGLAAVERR
jgi:hypothetical protein